jgi:proteasome assembly chaperone (PAC2) family protein
MMALQIANENRFMDKKSIQEIIKIYASQLGVEIDLEIMNENITSEDKIQATLDAKNQDAEMNRQIQVKQPAQISPGSK